MNRFDPDRRDFTPYGFTCLRWSPTPMRRPDHHNEIEMNFLRKGSLTYLLAGRKVRIEANRLSLFWAAIPHQIIAFGEETDYYVATIPFAWFLQFRLPDRLLQPLLRGEVIREEDRAPSRFDRALMERWSEDLRSAERERHEVALGEIEVRLRRLSLGLPAWQEEGEGRATRPLSAGGLNKVEQMACVIAERYTEPLTVEKIAAAVELHPNYAMSLFKKAFDLTLMDYLGHHRVSHAQRLLATTDRKIVDVALESGFSSISRFNEAFRRSCGVTPREYRKQHAVSGFGGRDRLTSRAG
jgi:AraC family transcriptional regulator, melibiose operon regulatory protein